MEEIVIGTAFKNMVYAKALALHQAGESHGLINTDHLGNLEVFLNEEPKKLFMSLVYPNDESSLAGKIIYVGSNS